MDVHRVLSSAVHHGASDLHLQTGSPPIARVHGVLSTLQMDPLSCDDLEAVVAQIASDTVKQTLVKDLSADFAYVADVGRFRVNIYHERGQLCIAFRLVPFAVPTLEQLNLPPVIREIAMSERGLILVTGTTGSGKTTTLAAIIDYVNNHRRNRIITVEDPIEFVHTSNKSLVAQREVGEDAQGFLPSLREALRQDPDVILVGELRDLETMSTAIQAADTGHAVYSTVHSTTASQTVQRLIALFPPAERELLLMQLASNLEAVISQRLARTLDNKGRVPVVEIMRSTPVVKKLIMEGRTESLSQAIANRDSGMQLFDQHLSDLYKSKQISGTEAMRLATNPEAVSLAMRGITSEDTSSGLVR